MKSVLYAPLVLSIALASPLASQEVQTPVEATDAVAASAQNWNPADWDLEDSEFTPEAGWVFGKLDNGMRYIIRRNNRPEGTALVRMEFTAAALDEEDDERGYAHYVEHMAFNGSTNVPEGEMIKLLERKGLAFGADTNASTGFEYTQYKLDLPRADEDLLDTSLMLMRETASELLFDEEAVQREKGVILSERRVRNTYALQNLVDSLEFSYPDARIAERLPIGTVETIEAANAEKLRAYWKREYVPASTVLVVVGDFDPAMVEAKIRERFGDWEATASPDQPSAGPVDPGYSGATDIYLDPALTETVTLSRNFPYEDRADTLAERRKNLLRGIGTDIVSRRLNRLVRSEDPPFQGMNFSNSEFFEAGRTLTLAVATEEGGWRRGLETAMDEYRRALLFGVSEAEIAEQVANRRTALEATLANAGTRSNANFLGDAFAIARGDYVPDSPANDLARFEAAVADITTEAVLAAMREDYKEFEDPLIRFTGKTVPEGGAEALRAAVNSAMARAVQPPEMTEMGEFAYTDFGPAGEVVSDMRTEELDIRTLRFANGVRLNLKPTDLSDDRVSVRINVDGGSLLNTRDNPLAVELSGLLVSGGLGEHSRDDLDTILAGRSVGGSFGAGSETFISSQTTTTRDLELQLQLMAAYVSDPGYRPEGLGPWRNGLDDFFARIGRTPGSAFAEGIGPILSDNDPRFTRQPIEAYKALDFAGLDANISDRLETGAIEIAIVGDFEEDDAIRYVAQTFGALPQREEDFRAYEDRRQRAFTDDRRRYTLTHEGEPDQAIIQLVWPTTDDDDWQRTSELEMLSGVARLLLLDKLREELGQTYSPSASASQSNVYDDYGTFSMGAAVDVGDLDATYEAMVEVVEALRSGSVDEDLLQRARQPILESLDNRLKNNGGWMVLVDRAQSRSEDIERYLTAKDRYSAITPEQVRALAVEYLTPAQAVEIRVVPSEEAMAKAQAGADVGG